MRCSLALVVAAIWVLTTASTATAAPPPNDARAAAQPLGALPASVRGTVVDATAESDEPPSGCAGTGASVWYSFTAPESRSIVIALDAEGDLDAAVDVFVRERSQLTGVDCRRTNRRGAATLDLDAAGGTDYVIRVAALANSVKDRFRLRVVEPDRPASFPGPRLPRRGVSAAVDRIANPDDAWSVRLKRGVAYRFNMVSTGGRCAIAELHRPGAGEIVRRMRCDAHTVFVPPSSGLHTLLVQAPRGSRERIRYRLRAGRAGPDDTAPGIRLANDRRVKGSLRGSELDAVDLYRFTVARPSRMRISLATSKSFDLRLERDTGGRLACDCGFAGGKSIELRLKPGRYFVIVRARDGAGGRYALRRLARTITHARTLVNGSRSVTVAPGASVTLELAVSPPVAGRATLLVERFDPLSGWLFDSQHRVAVRAGRATLAFRRPAIGRWRVTGSFEGTRHAAPSEGGTAHFTVAEPLED
jgi:hypothetical protein